MNQSDDVLALFKFGNRNHLDQFISEGLLYMNTLEHFARREENAVRADANEGIWLSYPAETVKLGFKVKIQDEYVPIPGLVDTVKWHQRDSLKANVFCMYGLRASNAEALVDPRNFQFGDSFVLLKDGNEFMRRAREAAHAVGQAMRIHSVEYVNRHAHIGEMGPFRKYSEFAYQSEVRLALLPGTGAVCELRLGDLSDLVGLTGPLDDVNRWIKVDTTDRPTAMYGSPA